MSIIAPTRMNPPSGKDSPVARMPSSEVVNSASRSVSLVVSSMLQTFAPRSDCSTCERRSYDSSEPRGGSNLGGRSPETVVTLSKRGRRRTPSAARLLSLRRAECAQIAAELVKRGRLIPRLVEVEHGQESGQVVRFDVASGALHAGSELALRVADRVGICRRRGSGFDASDPSQRFDAGERPCLDLTVCNHHA